MIQFLAKKTACYLAKDCDIADVEVLTYGYYILYQEWIVRIGMLLVALSFGLFFHVLTSIIVFNLIRRSAMGSHAKYPILCRIITYTVAFGPAILAVYFALRLTAVPLTVLYAFSVVSLLLYAPAETDVKKVNCPIERKQLKKEAVVWLTVLFLIAVLINGLLPEISFVIVATAVAACCMTHPWMYWINGFDPVTKEVRRN